jgi:hypothetical protein
VRNTNTPAKWLSKLEASTVRYMQDGAYLEFSARQRRIWTALEKDPEMKQAVLSAWRAKHPA